MQRKLIGVSLLIASLVVPNFVFAQHNKDKKSKKSNEQTVVQLSNNPNAQNLPIRRVILYSNGVAYIERRGTVSGNAEVNLQFKQSQVDDVLKSMIVLDLGQGRIGAVSYNSSAPPAARIAEIPFAVAAQTNQQGGIAGVLAQLQGAKVSVTTTKGAATGAILTVESRPVQVETNKPPVNTHFLVIASDGGEISSFDLADVKSVKLLEDGTVKDVNEFANATASARRRDAKTISVTSEGAGQREMVVSYTIAAPILKTTYRVVLDQEGKPFFQGWAIVDNVSEEDWKNVQLSLVSGTPISFIQPIQQPFYRYRPIVPIPNDLQLTPQVYEEGTNYSSNGISGLVTDSNGAVVPNATVKIRNNSTGEEMSANTSGDGTFLKTALPTGNYTVTAYASGFKTSVFQNVGVGANLQISLQVGNIAETVTVTADATVGNVITQQQITQLPTNGRNFSQLLKTSPGIRREPNGSGFQIDGASNSNYSTAPTTSVSEALLSNNSGVSTAATGDEIGDLFEYKIEQPITVNRNRSALIPIVQTKMDGERVSIYNEAVRRDRAMGGMKLVNTTPLTLEGGSLTVIDKDSYAGEALMERLKPKEQRFISYALDLGTLITIKQNTDNSPAKLVKVVNGVFQVNYFREEKKTYTLQNQTDKPRVVFVEYPVRSGWELSDETPKPTVTTARYYRFRVELKSYDKQEITIGERQGLVDNYALTSITEPQLELFLSRRYINEDIKKRLEKLIDLRGQINQIDAKLEAFNEEEEKIAADQKRLRENIEALSKTPEAKVLITRYIGKANDQETRLENITKERQTLETQKGNLENELAAQIKAFNL